MSGPSGMLNDSKWITWKPSVIGNFEMILIANDINGGSDTCNFVINISSSNQPPVLSHTGNRNIDENEVLTIVLSATDDDGDSLKYNVINNPSGSSLDDSIFTWTPAYNQAGSYDVIFSVSDDEASDSEIVTITVNNVNQAPVLAAIGARSANENELLTK